MFLKKIIKNTIIFALGNIFSKIMLILLLPILTKSFTQKEFGYIDLFTMLLSLGAMIIGFNSVEYLIKITAENQNSKNKLKNNLTAVIKLNMMSSIPLFLIAIPAYYQGNDFILLVSIAVTLQLFENTFKQFQRALDHNYLYIISEFLYTILFVTILIYSIKLEMGYKYYFIAVIISYLISIIYLSLFGNIIKYIEFKKTSKDKYIEILVFSYPLMMNSIMWYLINLSNRYFLIFFVGLGSAGVLAANSRIPMLIVILYGYLYKAIQIVIYKERNSKADSTITLAFGFLFTIVILLVGLNDFIVQLLLKNEFSIISNWLPIMYLSSIYSSYASILGINYMIANNTKLAFKTSLYCAIISIFLNLSLIPALHIKGAILSTFISFFFLVLIRLNSNNKDSIQGNSKKLFLSNIIVLFLFGINFYIQDNNIFIFLSFICLIINIILYSKEIIQIRST